MLSLMYFFNLFLLYLITPGSAVVFKYKEEKCQSWVKIEIRETEEELKALLRKEKDAARHEKLQVLYWLKTQTVETVLSAAVRRKKTAYHNTKMVV